MLPTYVSTSLRFLSIGIVTIATGCSIRPLPENVTRDKTYSIVQRIRCEMRDALRSYTRGALIKFGHADLANQLRADPSLFASFDKKLRSRLQPDLQAILSRYDQGAIGYEFTFDIDENNNLGGGLSIGRLVSGGSFGFSAGASADKTRQNKRNFIIVDNMEFLVKYLDKDNAGSPICAHEVDAPNFAHPIAGSLGLDEYVGTFFNLYEFGSLSTKKDMPSIFADTLTFTTTISADIGGKLTISPVRDSLKITDANAGLTARRTDKHMLVLTIALPAEPSTVGQRLTLAEQNAQARSLVRKELDRQRIITLDTENSIIRQGLLDTFVNP